MTPIPARSSSLNTIPSFAQKKNKKKNSIKIYFKAITCRDALKPELCFEEGRGSADVLIWFNRKMKKSI